MRTHASLILLTFLLFAIQAAAQTRVVGTSAGAPSVIDVTVETKSVESGNGTTFDPINIDPGAWRVDGQAPVSVWRYSVPYDELPAANGNFPVTVRHHVYVRIATPFAEGHAYAVTGPYGNTTLAFGSKTTLCDAIHANQETYSRLSTLRFANYGVYLGNGGTVTYPTLPSFLVLDGAGNAILSSTGVDMGDDTGTAGARSGERVYRLNLNMLGEGGPYVVSVPGCGISRPFGVGDAGSRRIAYTAMRGLYHQRCGIALDPAFTTWSRPICSNTHRQIADVRQQWNPDTLTVPAGTPTISVIGGYHDAGDFDRRPMHVIIPIMLLSYYEAFPTHFRDSQYGIPESGNGMPDVLDEALWGLLVWKNLQITNTADPKVGGVRAGTGETRIAVYGVDNAANDPGVYGTWDVTEEVTAFSAGMFAHASRLVAPFNASLSQDLLSRARLAWAYLTRTGNVNAPHTYFMYAAEQLYLATGEAAFDTIFKNAVTAIVLTTGSWPEQYAPGNFGMSGAKCQTSHFSSYALANVPRAVDPAIVAGIRARIIHEADIGGYFGLNPVTSAYPLNATSFLAWGATTSTRFDAPAFAYLFTADMSARQRYYNAMSAMADFSLGLNPTGMSFITGLGTDVVQSPLHLDSYFTSLRGVGDVPGITIYGPGDNSGAPYQLAVWGKLFPPWDQLPVLRRYADGWSNVNQNEFTTWETSIFTAAVHGFLYDASGAVIITPPPPDAGVSPDASAPDVVVADASVPPPDVTVPKPDVVVPPPDTSIIGVNVCVQPAPPPPVCGPITSVTH